jgi:hypothetical protein
LLREETRACAPLSRRAMTGSFLPELTPANGRAAPGP